MGTDDTWANRLLSLYNELDHLLRHRLGANPSISHAALIDRMAARDPVFRNNASRLHAFRSLRNSLVHLTTDGDVEPIAEPRADVVDDYAELVKYVRDPPTALKSIAVTEVYTVGWETLLVPSLSNMLDRGYRLAPIVRDGNLEGMFTESTLAQMIVKSRDLHITEGTRFEDLRKITEFGRIVLGVRILSSVATIDEVEDAYQAAFRGQEFLSVVCLTATGRAREPLLGIVTAHDLPSANGNPVVRRR